MRPICHRSGSLGRDSRGDPLMRLLIDQDVYQVTTAWLRGEGHDVVTARELGMQRGADEALLRKARELNRLFLTRDKDFGALVFLQKELSTGVIFLRMLPSMVGTVHQQLERLLQEHSEGELRDFFCVVEPHRYRIRRLESC